MCLDNLHVVKGCVLLKRLLRFLTSILLTIAISFLHGAIVKYPIDISVPQNSIRVDICNQPNRQKLDGFGAEFDPFIWTKFNTDKGFNDEDWDLIVKRVQDMRLQKIRVMVLPEWFEPQNDNDDPNKVDMNSFTWQSHEMEGLYRVLDLAEQEDINVNLTLWGATAARQSWLSFGNVGLWVNAPKYLDEWSENFSTLIKYLSETKQYTCIKQITPYNEPDWAFVNDKNEVDFDYYVKMVKDLDRKLKQDGIRDQVELNVSDDATNPKWLKKSLWRLTSVADSFNSHIYKFSADSTGMEMFDWTKTLVNYTQLFAPGKPHTINEFGSNQFIDSHHQKDTDTYGRGLMYARHAINSLNAGSAGTLAWVLFDQYYDETQLMELGLWRFKDKNWEARPMYYSWSLITRYTTPGADIYRGKSSDAGIGVTALKSPEGKLTYLISNETDTEKTVSIVDKKAGSSALNKYVMTENTLPNDGLVISSSGEAAFNDMVLTEIIPPQSFILLSDID